MMESQASSRSRRSSGNRSFHSIDEFRESPIDFYPRSNRFPIRPTVNILLILLTTLQVYILVTSRIYLRGELVRTFLSVYVDTESYPQLFAGNEFYLEVKNVGELRDHFEFMFERINKIDKDSFIDLDYKNSKIALHTQYKSLRDSSKRQTVHDIDPKEGITEPFDMTNITSIQLYLLEVEQFQLRVDSLHMKENWEGFSEKYVHDITYQYLNSIMVRINFSFKIDNAMIEDEDRQPAAAGGEGYQDAPSYPIESIVKVRVFYGIVMIMATFSLYLNFISVRTTFKVLYYEFGEGNMRDTVLEEGQSLLRREEIQGIREDVRKWIQANGIAPHEMGYKHYFHLLEFDVIFSVMSNVFEIIAGFYLISGIEKERMAGVACLFSWLTVFKFLRKYKKLVLMYELIKLSISRVTLFFVEFLPVFLSYTLLGICLFPKVSFFSSLADSVTTLVSLMMGDSIEMITAAIIEKNSVLSAIIYIFSFVLMFMHAIHNTLTSLIKEFFILKKIELVKEEKERKKENDYIYIDELKTESDLAKSQLPLKLTPALKKDLLRIQSLAKIGGYNDIIRFYWSEVDRIRLYDNWIIEECNLSEVPMAKQELVRRALYTRELINKRKPVQPSSPRKKRKNKSPKQKRDAESMLTDGA